MDIAKFEEYLRNKGYSDEQINVLKNMYLPNQQKQESQGSSILSGLIQYPQSLLHGLWESPAEAVSMIGRAIQYPAEKFGIPVLRDIGKWIESGGEAYTKGVSQILGSPEQYTTVPRWIYEAGKMTVPSIGLGVLTRTSAIPASVFGLAQAEDVRRAAEEKGIKSSTLPEIASGLVEALGEYFGTKYLTKLLGGEVKAPQKLVDILSKIPGLGESAESLAKYLKTAAVEAGTEFGQELFESGIEKYSGIRPEAQPFMEALSVIPPTLLMTAMMSPLEGRLAKPQKYVPEAPPKEITDKESITPPLLTQEESNLLPIPASKYLSAPEETKYLPVPAPKYLPAPEKIEYLPAPKEAKYLPPPKKGGFPVIDSDTDNHILNTALSNASSDTIRRLARYYELTGDEFIVKDQEGKDIRLTPDQLREYADIKEISPYIINKDVDSAILNYTLKNLDPGEIDHLADVLEEKEKSLGETGHPDMPLGLGLPVKLSDEGGTIFLSPETLRRYADLKRQMRQQEELSGAIPTERVKVSPSSSEPVSLIEPVKTNIRTPMEPAFLKRLNDAITRWSNSKRVKHIASTIVKPNVGMVLKHTTREVSTNNPEQAAFIRVYFPDGTYKEALVKSKIPVKSDYDILISSIYKARTIAKDLSSKINAPIEVGYYEKSGDTYTPRTDYIAVNGKFIAPTARVAQDITNHPGVNKELPNYFISQENQPISYGETKDLTKPAVKITPSEESKVKQESIQPSEEVRVTEQTPQLTQNIPQPESIHTMQKVKTEAPVTKSEVRLTMPQQEIEPIKKNIKTTKETKSIIPPTKEELDYANGEALYWSAKGDTNKKNEIRNVFERELDHTINLHEQNIDKKLKENEYATKISIMLPDGTKIIREGVPYSEAIEIAKELGDKIRAPIYVQGRSTVEDIVATRDGIRYMTEAQFNNLYNFYFTKEFSDKIANDPKYKEDIYNIYRGNIYIDNRVSDLVNTIRHDPEKTESLLNKIENEEERENAEKIVAIIRDEFKKIDKLVKEVRNLVDEDKLTLSKANIRRDKIERSVKIIDNLALHLNNYLSEYIGSFRKYPVFYMEVDLDEVKVKRKPKLNKPGQKVEASRKKIETPVAETETKPTALQQEIETLKERSKASKKSKLDVSQQEIKPKEETKIQEEAKPSTPLTEDEIKNINKKLEDWRSKGEISDTDEIKEAINKEVEHIFNLHKSDIERDIRSGAPTTEIAIWLPDGSKITRGGIPYSEATSIASKLSSILDVPVFIKGQTVDLDRIAIDGNLKVMSEPQLIKNYRGKFTKEFLEMEHKKLKAYDEEEYRLLRGELIIDDKVKPIVDLIKNNPEKINSMIDKIENEEDKKKANEIVDRIKEELNTIDESMKIIKGELEKGESARVFTVAEKKLDIATSQLYLNNLSYRLLKYLKIEGKKPTSLSIETEGKSNVYNLDAERAKTIPKAFRDYNEFDVGRDFILMGDLAEKLRKGDITTDERKEMGRLQKLIDDITSKVERGEVSAIDAIKYAADQMESYSFLTGRSNYNDFALKALRTNLADKIESELAYLAKNGELSSKLSSPLINKLNEHMQRILGGKVPIIFVNKEELTKALKMLGITPESLVDALARHGVYPKDKSDLLKIISSIKGVTTLLDIKKPAILLVRNDPDIIKTAFHEVMEAIVNSGQLPKNAMKILEKTFSGKERHWKEEAADAFAKYYATERLDHVPKYQQMISKIFNKIKSIIDRIVNFFHGYGYLSPYDIFEDIANGKYRFLDKNGNVDPVKYDAYLGDKINELSLSLSPEFREKDDRHWSQKILDFINDVRKGIKDSTMMSSFEKNFLPPQWIRREPIQKLLDIMIKSQESRNLSVYSTSKEFIDKYDSLPKDMRDKLDKAIIYSGELEVVLNDKELKDKFGLDEEAISAYKEFKTSMDKIFRNYITSKQRMIIDIISRMPGYRHITPEIKDKLIRSIIMENPTQFVNSIKDLMNTTHKNTINAISEFIDRFTIDNNIELTEKEKSELIDMLDDIVTNVDRLENYYSQLTKGFYFPRIRPNGRYAIKVYKYTTYIDSDGKEKTGWVDIYREHTKKGSGLRESIEATRIYNRVKRELQKQAYNVIEITDRNQLNEIKPKNKNDIVLIKDINEAPSSLFYDNVTNETVMRYLKYITEDLEERTTDETKKEMLKEIIDHITSNIDIDLRRRSMALSRLIQRERRVEKSDDEEMTPIITGGYDKNVAKAFKQYVVAMSGNISRINTTRSIKQLFDSQNIRKQITQDPNLFEYVKDYIEAVGIEANPLDRFSSMASSLLVSHFLGFRFSSAFVQLTQSALTGFSELQGFVKADADALRKYKPNRYLSASDVKLNEYLETHGNVIGRYFKSYIEAAKIMTQYIRNPSSEGLVGILSEKLNLTKGELSLLTKLINSKVESAYVLDLHRETTGKVPTWMASFTKNSLWLFARAEETTRIAGALAAYRLAKEKGLTREEAIEFASKYIDRAYHIYNIFNKPLIALKKDTSSVVRMLTLLKNYQINFVGWAYDSLKRENGKRYADKVVTSALWHMIFGGLFGVPLLKEIANFFAWLLSKTTGEPYDPEKAIVRYIKKNIGEDAGKMAEFGIMSLLGVDISGSIRMDLLPKEWSETGIVDTLLGAWRGVGTSFTEAKLALERGDILRALSALSPVVIDKSLVAYRNIANNEPMRTLYGTPITDPYGRPIKLSSSDMLLTLLGFRPITLAESSSTFQATDTIKKFYTKKRNSIYSKLRYAKTYEDLSKIIESDVNNYNMRVAKYGGAVPLITATSIKGVLKRAKGEPNKLAILMDEWGELEDLEEAS